MQMATTPTASPRTLHPSRALRIYGWIVTVYTILVIVWGGAVTATGSGNGCGDHWPLCDGQVVVSHPHMKMMIEYAHRLSSGVVLFAILGLLVWTWLSTPRRHIARMLSIAAVILVINEALLGAGLVLFRLTTGGITLERVLYFALHFTNTFLLLAAVAGTAHFLSRNRGYLRGQVRFRSLAMGLPGLLALLIVAVSGSVAELGDSLYPPSNLRAAILADFSSHGSWIIRLRWLHPAFALLAGAFLLWLVFGAVTKPALRSLGFAVLALLGLQYTLGVADVLLLAPTWMQLAHLFVADVLWVTVFLLATRLCVVDAAAIPRPQSTH
jgi:cytochrome c oxidase assembly protein subunit 15